MLAIPTPGSPIVIPGLVEIAIGSEKRKVDGSMAKARADVLNVKLVPTGTQVRVAHTGAKLTSGVKRGLFAGFAAATQVTALSDLVKSGPQPQIRMPCQGTHGKVKGKDVAAVDLAPLAVVGAASTRQLGRSTDNKASGYEQAASRASTSAAARSSSPGSRARPTSRSPAAG